MTRLIDCETVSNVSTSTATDVTPPEGQDDVDYMDYRVEAARLDSFADWKSNVDPKKLAAAGFYYTGKDDIVKCFECHLEMREWTEHDNPIVDHQRWSGSCRFIRQLPCGNVPIGTDPDTIPRVKESCESYGVQYKPNSFPDLPDYTDKVTIVLDKLPGAAHPEYSTYRSRLHTFEIWPATIPQKKEVMALAGFYYTGKEDITICFYCGGGLGTWEPDDMPMDEHVQWFTRCKYVLNIIEKVGMKLPELSPSKSIYR